MFKPFRVRLLEADGKSHWWTVRCGKLGRGNLGQCCYDTRTITIVPQLDETETLGVLVHEIFHATCPDLVEEATLRFEHNWLAVFRPLLEQLEVF